MPEYDQTAEWRGIVTTTVQQHTEKLATLNGDLRDIRNHLGQLDTHMTETRIEIVALRKDIEQVTDELEANRKADTVELQRAIREAKVSWRQFLIYIIAPIVTGVVAAVIVAHLINGGSASPGLILDIYNGIANGIPHF